MQINFQITEKPVISRSGKEICPPADPVYNFLADETRDGRKKGGPPTPNSIKEDPMMKATPGVGPKKHNKPNNQPQNNRDRNVYNDKKSVKLQRSKSQNEGNNWRQQNGNNMSNNRETNRDRDHNREKRHSQQENQSQFNRQKSLNEKHFNNNYNNNGNLKNGQNQFQYQPQNFHPQQNQQFSDSSQRNQDFGNISVSVSRDGEVKSVRLTCQPVIGSGRVAHSRQNMKPQFNFVNMNEDQGFNPQMNQGFQQHRPNHQPADKKFQHRNRTNYNSNGNSNKSQNQSPPPLVPLSQADLIKKTSVQDRLLKNRALNNNEQFAGALNQTAQ